jgi:hypothetical protein
MLLWDKENKATARKTDPQTSQDAADGLNAVDGVTAQEREVLAALRKYGPCTAKELGGKMGKHLAMLEGYDIVMPVLYKILAEARKPHSRLKALVVLNTSASTA